jgi:uncharacterized oxidoreductase
MTMGSVRKLSGETILITGGTAGIGYALAKALAPRNTVIVTGRNEEALQRARKELGVVAYRSDVSKPQDITALHAEVAQVHPALSVLVNNAGEMRTIDLNTVTDLEGLVWEVNTNLSGPMRMVQAFLPLLKQQEAALIVNVTSGFGYVPFAAAPIYGAAKAGLHAYTQALRGQLRDSAIRVVELAPPATNTRLMGALREGPLRHGLWPVERLVQAAIRGIERGQDEISPGQSGMLRVLGGILPEFVLNKIIRMQPYSIGRD